MNELCRIIDGKDNCPGYNKCNGFPWFDWQDMRWCSHQVYWIIEFSKVFIGGIWPDPPEYLETDVVQKAMSTEAIFVKATSTLAEVEARLLRTGRDGRDLVKFIQLGCPVDELTYDARMAFYYISGWGRYGLKCCPLCRSRTKGDICPNHGKVKPVGEKRMKYLSWKKQRKYRAKRESLTTKSH